MIELSSLLARRRCVDHLITDLLNNPKVLETREHMHHSIPKYDHLRRSVKYSARIARMLHADERVCVRAALIHDIDSRAGTLTTHGKIAADWAAAQGECAQVCLAIVSHMFPFGPKPTTREAWVLVLADKAASLGDMKQFVGGLLDGTSMTLRRQLLESDPYYRVKTRRAHKQRLNPKA
ncbi:MAG: HD domain-containing protein [Roseiflexaceae bacterium]|nr:HD domain-containing protein [Roseiflexaceae bacterium]